MNESVENKGNKSKENDLLYSSIPASAGIHGREGKSTYGHDLDGSAW
jgi:hypothetical protein